MVTIQQQIENYINTQLEPKRTEMLVLHERIDKLVPNDKRWFLDGKNEDGKVVSNPNIGYGLQTIHYADKSSREFYQIGMSSNASGISIYLMTIKDKTYLLETYGASIGKAKVTGYCIRFKTIKDIHLEVLEAAIQDGIR